MNDNFASRLKKLREEHGLSQAELADKLGVSRGSISFYENKSRVPDIDVLLSLCNYFSVPSDYLIGLSDDPKPAPTATQETGLSYYAIERLDAWNTRYPDGKRGLNALSRIIVYSDFFHLLLLIQELLDFAAADGSSKYVDPDVPQTLIEQIKEYGYQPISNSAFRASTVDRVSSRFRQIISSIVSAEEHRAAEQYCKDHGIKYVSTTLSDAMKESQEYWKDTL